MHIRRTVGRALAEAMAAENRRIVSDWRALLLLRQQTAALAPEERRWSEAPVTLDQVRITLNRLVATGDLRRIKGLAYVFESLAPFAKHGGVEEQEVLMEVNPFAALSHATALAFHGLTEDFPQDLHLVVGDEASIRPTGVAEGDWDLEWPAPARRPERLFGKQVHWHSLHTASAALGTAEYRPRGYPVRVTTPERTLLDGLQRPDWCGGSRLVLAGWARAKDTLDVEELVRMVDVMDIGLLRQRVGFVMESLGFSHPRFEQWVAQAKRGGSSKLVGSEPFASTFSERWKLSLNAPVDVLHDMEAAP